MRLWVAACAMLCACHTAAPAAAGTLTVLGALSQMLDSGAITVEQFVALKAAVSASDGNWWTAAAGGTLSVALAWIARKSAVKKVMRLRGPTETERQQRKAAPPT